MTINTEDGAFQACYWRDAARIGEDPDAAEYSDYAMELRQRIHALFKQGTYAYAALFRWSGEEWEWVEEYDLRTTRPGAG